MLSRDGFGHDRFIDVVKALPIGRYAAALDAMLDICRFADCFLIITFRGLSVSQHGDTCCFSL